MKNIKTVLMQKKYFLLFSTGSVLSFAILYVLMFLAIYDYSLNLYIEMNGLSYTIATLFLSVIISALLGIYASLVFYRLGAALGLLFFPFKGLELKLFSIIVLAASIFLMSKNPTSCKTK